MFVKRVFVPEVLATDLARQSVDMRVVCPHHVDLKLVVLNEVFTTGRADILDNPSSGDEVLVHLTLPLFLVEIFQVRNPPR